MKDDTVYRQAAIDLLEELETKRLQGDVDLLYAPMIKGLKALPSAKPKTGRWIYHIDDLFPTESTMECNKCHATQPLTCDDNFCPNCGRLMEVEHD